MEQRDRALKDNYVPTSFIKTDIWKGKRDNNQNLFPAKGKAAAWDHRLGIRGSTWKSLVWMEKVFYRYLLHQKFSGHRQVQTPKSVGLRCTSAGDLASLVSKPPEPLMPHLSTVSCWLTLKISHMILFAAAFPMNSLWNPPHKKPKAKYFFQATETESIFLTYWKLVANSPVFQSTFGCLFMSVNSCNTL